MITQKKVIIAYLVQGEQLFKYSGIILSQDNNFLELDDIKEGIIKLNIRRVISIKEARE